MSTIFELIDAGDAAGIRELLAREPQAAAAHDAHGLSAIMRASYRGGEVFAAVREAHPPLGPFDRIVIGESDQLPGPDDRTPDGFTALHIAAFVDNVAAAERLLDAGDGGGIRELLAREPQAAAAHDAHGLSAIMRASYRGGEVFAAVREAHPPLGPFDRIVVGESDQLPGPDDRTPDGFTGLHIAAFVDNVAAAERLLDAGADPNAVSTASFARVTPLGTCAFTGALGVAKVLLAHGADPRIGEDGKYTAEAEAIARGNEDLAALIREATR